LKKDGVEPPADGDAPPPADGDAPPPADGDDAAAEGGDEPPADVPVEIEDVMLPPNELDITACN